MCRDTERITECRVWRSVLITKTAPLFSTRSCPAGECARARHTFYICFICLSYHKRKNMCQKCCAIGAACWVFNIFFWESVQSMLNAGRFFLSRGVFAVSVASELFLYACATIKANSMLQAPSGFFRSHVFVLFFLWSLLLFARWFVFVCCGSVYFAYACVQ